MAFTNDKETHGRRGRCWSVSRGNDGPWLAATTTPLHCTVELVGLTAAVPKGKTADIAGEVPTLRLEM